MTHEGHHLSTDLDDPNAYPYFLWDDPMTNAELRHRLATASVPERTRLLRNILREAREWKCWRNITPREFAGGVGWVIGDMPLRTDPRSADDASTRELERFRNDLRAHLARLAFLG